MGTFGAEEVFGITPDEVIRASSELDGHGSALRETGKSLSGGGAPPRDCLPGGLAAEYLEIAADRVGKLAAAEGSSTGSAASELRIFVDAVTGAESGSAERLGGRRR